MQPMKLMSSRACLQCVRRSTTKERPQEGLRQSTGGETRYVNAFKSKSIAGIPLFITVGEERARLRKGDAYRAEWC